MRPHSVRLLLAGNLRLGEPLRTALPLTDDARNIVLDSTLDTWRQIQDYAIDREAEVFILDGNTIVAEQLSSHAEFALIEGLELLADAGIPVIIRPGELDPLSFWKGLLPDLGHSKSNLTLVSQQLPNGHLLLRNEGKTSVIPEGRIDQINEADVIARFVSLMETPDDDHRSTSPVIVLDDHTNSATTIPRGIDLLLAGQTAIWRTNQQESSQQVHYGSHQPLSLEESQQNAKPGCLLIDISSQNDIHTEQLSTSVVRFHTANLNLSSCNDWEDAALTMQNQIESLSWGAYERLKLITWTILGNDRLSNKILNGDDSHLLAAWNDSFASQHDENLVIHGFQPGGQFPLDLESACSGIELAEALLDIEQSADQPDTDRLAAVWASDQSSAALLTRLRPVLNPAQIGTHAESVVTQWLTQSDPENLTHENHTP